MAFDSQRTFYEVLSLPNSPQSPLSGHDIKRAYRQALLNHHPDKNNGGLPMTTPISAKTNKDPGQKPTIDEITTAYRTLSTPSLRAEYDIRLSLLRVSEGLNAQENSQSFRTGLETIDLDDFECDEEQPLWSLACRCGHERGYLIKEKELEEAEESGEISVGCQGCSLWIRVLFGVVGGEEVEYPSSEDPGTQQ